MLRLARMSHSQLHDGMDVTIRDATVDDFDRINEIYNWTIIDNHVSFDTEPWDRARREAWWNGREPDLSCLVAEVDGRVVGVSYSSWYRPKVAYRSSMETTIVLDESAWGRGIGTRLLRALLTRLEEQGVHVAIAIVALPNEASVRLHHRLGYVTAGTLHEVGHKNGRYVDTVLLEKLLG
jgi:phosphinothricin acetyltransferase